MYIYGFTTFAWHDKVQKTEKPTYKQGDLVSYGNDIFLALGDEVSFFEQYEKKYISTRTPEILYKNFLFPETIALLHWMVYYRYTTYKSVIRYFLPEDIEWLLKQEVAKKKKKENQITVLQLKSEIYKAITIEQWQNLIIFPDLWTLYNLVPEQVLQHEEVVVLHPQQSSKQKNIHWWQIKTWEKKIILCTHAELFQDYNDLKKIVIIQPSTWYYANQQDPRYKVKTIVEKMGEIYSAKVETRGE